MPQGDAEGFQVLISNKWKTKCILRKKAVALAGVQISQISDEKYSENALLQANAFLW